MARVRPSAAYQEEQEAQQTETIVFGKVSKRKQQTEPIQQKKVTDIKDAMLTSQNYKLTRRQPHEIPPFTLEDLRNEIKDLFRKPFHKTMFYIILNLFYCTAHFVAHLYILKLALFLSVYIGTAMGWDLTALQPYNNFVEFNFEQPNYAEFITQTVNALYNAPFVAALESPALAVYTATLAFGVWNYCYWQGHFFTGLLIIGHETGHKALFEKELIWFGHIFGWIFHSFLFIPYFSWSFTHRVHHTFNKNQSYDEVHMMRTMGTDSFKSIALPHEPDVHPSLVATKKPAGKFYASFKALAAEMHENIIEFNFPYRVFYYFLYFTIGYPMYLVFNAGGNVQKYGSPSIPPNHFSPNSPVFAPGEGLYVIISNIGLILNCVWIYFAYQAFGGPFVFFMYFIPWLWTHYYFVMYTLGHHAHPTLPSYSGDRWNYLQGAMSTIDRTHGPLIDYLWHYISRTHVIHHIFSDLPFYNSMEATERLKPIMGDYYMYTDEDNVWFGSYISLWKHIRDCTFLAEDNHPGLVLMDTAYNTAKKLNLPLDHPKVEAAVDAKLPEALENNPHKNGRVVDNEVYWPRTFQL